MRVKTGYIIGGFIIAVSCFLCARPYLADRAPFSFTEAESVTRVENRSVFAFPEMTLHRGTYTVQCATDVPSEIEISVQDAGAPEAVAGAEPDMAEAITGAFEGVMIARSGSRIETLPVRIAPGSGGSRAFCIFVEENGVPARVVIREYYESGGVPAASFDTQVIYRPALSASYAVLRMLFAVLLPFVLWMLIRYRMKNREGTESLIPLLLYVLILFISAPLLARFVLYGHDTLFHMRRIANLAEEFFSGRIPVRIAQTWKNGHGYPVSIFYGDIFMLEAAVLFKLGVPLWRCYRFYLLSVNAATVVLSYHCFRKLSGKAWTGFFGSVMYAASVRYLANLYLRGAIGEATAMAFLPLVVCGFYELFAGRHAVPYLVCGFTALIQSHTLTTIQAAVFAALFCLPFARRLLREGRLKTLAVSAGLTLLVNLWFIVPFVDYYLRHHFFARHAEPVAESAVKLPELIFPEEMYSAVGKGTLLLLLLAIACAVVLHVRRAGAKEPVPSYARGVAACEVLSVLAVLMGTEVFPWALLEARLPFVYGLLGGRIQYVWRYFSIATLLVVVTAMLVARVGDNRRTVPMYSLLLLLTCVESAVMLHSAYHPAPDTPVLRAADVWNGDGGDALYMFDDLVWHEVPRAEITASDGVTVSAVSHEGTTYRSTVENASEEDGYAEFPVWNYYGYVAITDGGSPLAVSDGEGHRIRVTVPAGFSGHLTVGFREPWYWRMAEAASVAVLILIICVIHRKYGMIYSENGKPKGERMTTYTPVKEGKVREIYDTGEHLIMVATDRISAFDVILKNQITGKGKVLTQMSRFWFDYTKDIVPNHMVSCDTKDMPEYFRTEAFEGRSMLCKKLTMLPVECIVRGYITGSGWASYQKDGTVCGIRLPEGLQESAQLPEPLFTPSTKAELGEHDENIDFDTCVKVLEKDFPGKGNAYAEEIRDKTIALYKKCAAYAREKGIIIADTKFEFGVDENGSIVLADEMLTPDSSRFWPVDGYEAGHGQPSFDKQFVRDYLKAHPESDYNLPQDVIDKTIAKYEEAYQLLTGK